MLPNHDPNYDLCELLAIILSWLLTMKYNLIYIASQDTKIISLIIK